MALDNMQLGGGSFNGRAINDDGVFVGIKEDVSPLVSLISPSETPLLTLIGDALNPAGNVLHEWLEDALSPNAIINSIAVASTTADTAIAIKGGLAAYIQKGAILRGPEAAGAEYMQVVTVTDNTLVVSRAFAGTTANSFAIGEFMTVISEAQPDGADVLVDTSRARVRLGNYLQNFKKDIIVDDVSQVVQHLGGIDDEFEYQVQKKLREALRDLEKAVILGRLSGNTIGTSSAVRTMRGIFQSLTTNSVNVTSMGTDYGSTTMLFFEARLTEMLQSAWMNGGTDLNVLVCGDEVKKRIDQLNQSRTRTVNEDTSYVNLVTRYANTYGTYIVMLNRWMPRHKVLALATGRLAVTPLRNYSFHSERVARTGQATKGMVSGQYTLELRNEAGMGHISFANFAPGAGERLLQAP